MAIKQIIKRIYFFHIFPILKLQIKGLHVFWPKNIRPTDIWPIVTGPV